MIQILAANVYSASLRSNELVRCATGGLSRWTLRWAANNGHQHISLYLLQVSVALLEKAERRGEEEEDVRRGTAQRPMLGIGRKIEQVDASRARLYVHVHRSVAEPPAAQPQSPRDGVEN